MEATKAGGREQHERSDLCGHQLGQRRRDRPSQRMPNKRETLHTEHRKTLRDITCIARDRPKMREIGVAEAGQIKGDPSA